MHNDVCEKIEVFLFCLNFFIMHLDGQGAQRTQFRHHDTYQKPIKVPFDRVPPMRNHTSFNHMQKPHTSIPIHKSKKPTHNVGHSPYYQEQKTKKRPKLNLTQPIVCQYLLIIQQN